MKCGLHLTIINQKNLFFWLVSTKIQRLSSIFVFQEKKISKNSNFGPFWVPFVTNWSNQSFRKKLGSVRFPGLWSKTCTGSTDRVQDWQTEGWEKITLYESSTKQGSKKCFSQFKRSHIINCKQKIAWKKAIDGKIKSAHVFLVLHQISGYKVHKNIFSVRFHGLDSKKRLR